MKYNKYVQYKYTDGCNYIKPSVLVTKDKEPCVICREKTEFYDIYDGVYLCGDECTDRWGHSFRGIIHTKELPSFV